MPWVKGQSGNPGGRSNGPSFATLLRKELAKTDRRDKTKLEQIAAAMVAKAVKGDLEAARWIADRVDGKVPQSVSVDSEHTVHVVPWLPAILNAPTEDEPKFDIEGQALPVEDPVEEAPPEE